MARLFLLYSLMLGPALATAQFKYAHDQSIPVQDLSGAAFAMPWAGGLNATQYNTFDLDNDGDDDLVLFDRMANKVITMLNDHQEYRYAPDYESLFPHDVTNWLLLRDYNCDGKKDLFTGDPLGIKVYENTTAAGEMMSWRHFLFFTGFSGSKSQVLLTKGFEFKVNLQLQFDDLPAITDADGDGDLDIFNFRYAGHTIEYHRNLSQERYGHCDSLDFERITQTWGALRECNCGNIALNGTDCGPSGGRTKHAGGKALTAMDINGDGEQDLIFSEAECAQLFQFVNEGTLDAPVINTYAGFPAMQPVNMIIFPAAYYEDVDFDGKKDLIASPNIFTKEFFGTNLQSSNRFYKNIGTDAHPNLVFTSDNFLQKGMIDVGDNAVPAFADYDGDGDQDMFVSRSTGNMFNSTIYYFENTGSPSNPAFRLVTEDFLFFSLSDYYNVKIQFADIDGNKTRDLVFTATNFANGRTGLFYLPNQSARSIDFSDLVILETGFSMTFDENLHAADVDGDGKTDILAGRSGGSVEFWKNTGSGSNITFALEDDSFLGLGSSVLRQNVSCFIDDLDQDGKQDLFFGDESGVLKVIGDYKTAVHESEAQADIIFNALLDDHNGHNLGGRLWPVSVNLFGTAKPSIVVGNILGGLHVLRNQNELGIFPNPATRGDALTLEMEGPTRLEIYSSTGRLVGKPVLLSGEEVRDFAVPNLAAGLYIFRFANGSRMHIKKIVIR